MNDDNNSQLLVMIEEIKRRSKIAETRDNEALQAHRGTAVLVGDALDLIGGPSFRSDVLRAAGIVDGVGNWKGSIRETARGYRRAQIALSMTTDRRKIIDFVGMRVPLI